MSSVHGSIACGRPSPPGLQTFCRAQAPLVTCFSDASLTRMVCLWLAAAMTSNCHAAACSGTSMQTPAAACVLHSLRERACSGVVACGLNVGRRKGAAHWQHIEPCLHKRANPSAPGVHGGTHAAGGGGRKKETLLKHAASAIYCLHAQVAAHMYVIQQASILHF